MFSHGNRIYTTIEVIYSLSINRYALLLGAKTSSRLGEGCLTLDRYDAGGREKAEEPEKPIPDILNIKTGWHQIQRRT
jgi:hypothetical protein